MRIFTLLAVVALLIGCARGPLPEPQIPISPFAEDLPRRISRMIEPRCWVAGYMDTHVATLSVNTQSLREGKGPNMRRVLTIACTDGSTQLLILED